MHRAGTDRGGRDGQPDLHYENVVDSGDSWVMVDPKPVIGDPEFGLAPLLRRRL
ncbi:MAG: aminoglycoside phosphotransferase family protein [Nakamurella sp.]